MGGADFEGGGGFYFSHEVVEGVAFVAFDGDGEGADGLAIGGGEGLVAVDGFDDGVHEGIIGRGWRSCGGIDGTGRTGFESTGGTGR